MTGRVWNAGDPEPPNSEVRQVRGASGAVYGRSPGGLHWFLRGGVSQLRHWPELLAHDGPLTAEAPAEPLTLFDLPGMPVPAAPMSEDEAEWVRNVVWTEHHRKWLGGPQDWHRCRCQWGPSGHCERGEHRDCAAIRGGQPLAGPETRLTVSGDKRLGVAVWLADRVCWWTCPCGCGHKQRRAS